MQKRIKNLDDKIRGIFSHLVLEYKAFCKNKMKEVNVEDKA
jgi:hypothetical protein